jgi:hypothetical protein
VTQQTWLDVLNLQRLLKQRVLLEVEHTKTKVQSGVKVPGELVELIFAQWLAGYGRACLVVDRPLVLPISERALGHFGRHCTVLRNFVCVLDLRIREKLKGEVEEGRTKENRK